MNCFIVSKNRACQLDACIRSIEKHAGHLITKVTVLYKATDDKFLSAYHKAFLGVEQRGVLRLQAIVEENFRSDFLRIVEGFGSSWVLFGVDDSLLFRKVPLIKEDFTGGFDYSFFSISLRLGRNTVIQDCSTDSPMKPPKETFCFRRANGERILQAWDWTAEPHDMNWGYPISLDLNMYPANYILEVSRKVEFNNLRTWEGEAVSYCWNNHKQLWPIMLSPFYSCAVNVPINCVQQKLDNVSPFQISETELNEIFLAGEAIDLDKTFHDVDVVGSHQWIQLQFKKVLAAQQKAPAEARA